MKIELIGASKVVMSNPMGIHNYFGWPSVARLQGGQIAVAASGYRLSHVCPFGKAVVAFSEDEGETYTNAWPVIDTVLDDRDAGIVPAAGGNKVIFTSFNNTTEFQRSHCFQSSYDMTVEAAARRAYCLAYLDQVSDEEQNKVLGSTYRISNDGGITYGPLMLSPITSPHGPGALKDGGWLWVGRVFSADDSFGTGFNYVQAYYVAPDGTMEKRGEIPNIFEDGKLLYSCEPHVIELPDGKLITHIRVQGHEYFTTYQSESVDGGYTWTKPHAILGKCGGAPAHLYQHSSGVLISVYGYREQTYGIRAMLSMDGGITWETDHVIWENPLTPDLGYPATVELKDGSLLTVFYAHEKEGEPAVILQQKWRLQ